MTYIPGSGSGTAYTVYKLVKEYNLSNQVLSDVLAWDGESNDFCHILCNMAPLGAGGSIYAGLNSDITAANYSNSVMYNAGNVTTGASSASAGFFVATSPASAAVSQAAITDLFLRMTFGRRKSFTQTGHASSVQSFAGTWSNTTSPVTSILFHSGGVAVTGNIRIFRLATVTI